MNIVLTDDYWVVEGGYIIKGNVDDGYVVYDEYGNYWYEGNDFESCLVWIWNSKQKGEGNEKSIIDNHLYNFDLFVV